MLAAGYQDDGIASATHVTVIVLDAYALECARHAIVITRSTAS
jgi:hypothetical protein